MLMEMFMKVNGKMVIEMDRVSVFGMMVMNIRVILKIISKMVREF